MRPTPPDGAGEARGPPGASASPSTLRCLMTFHFNFHHRLPDGLMRAALKRLETRLMSVLSDKIAEANASFDAAVGRMRGVVDALNAEVADLKSEVARGVATSDDLAALDALRNRIDALDLSSPAVLPEPPAEQASPTPEV